MAGTGLAPGLRPFLSRSVLDVSDLHQHLFGPVSNKFILRNLPNWNQVQIYQSQTKQTFNESQSESEVIKFMLKLSQTNLGFDQIEIKACCSFQIYQ